MKDVEVKAIIEAVKASGNVSFEKVSRAVKWCEGVRKDAALVQLAINGEVSIHVADDTGKIGFRLTKKGEEEAKKVVEKVTSSLVSEFEKAVKGVADEFLKVGGAL